ncbi:PEP/pyruvate-binding domain-containing protein [Streptomyces bambusae]|uniref:Pyruvate, phosphate dikinase n=1 Tax=Streptomyces bambusae TaxID=1550616 RepID=A0ABS6ZHF2_9ACTN|nr:PEP/pyruvate-binding domain-containing protein [Streptomyces bambusae]MBW5486065.1 pyruvate, phosphate dikinase [Streptomyces bambusae]
MRLVMDLDDPAATLETAGGKGSALAELARAGLPVPDGFHVTTAAYREFVTSTGLGERIAAALAEDSAGAQDVGAQGAGAQGAGARIRAAFGEAELPDAVRDAVVSAYARLGDGDRTVAVRSSATAEDLPDLSFAGQQDTYLGIRGEAALLRAVRDCWASLWTDRAIAYRARAGIAHEDVALAVVVQELVEADAAGVMFTVDPLGGRADRLVVNAAWGLGEAVVSGLVTPDTMVVERRTLAVVERRTATKEVMTVRTDTGTREEPVPADRREAAVLTDAETAELARLGLKIEELYDEPRDVEWARSGPDGGFRILQARPVTTVAAPVPEVWNDSTGIDALWTSANLGEAVPDVMTPATWSFVQRFMGDVMVAARLEGRPMYGNIGGRLYMNLSVTASLAAAFGQSRKFAEANELVFGRLPEGVTIPLLPASRLRVWRETVGEAAGVVRRIRANGKKLPGFLAEAPGRCTELRAEVSAAPSAEALLTLWQGAVSDHFRLCCHMLQAATRQDGDSLVTVRAALRGLVGEEQADLMTTGLGDEGQLASMGPLLGLERLARGEIDREAYTGTYGHRGPHEFEVSAPRPAEDPQWLDRQLAALGTVEEDAGVRLERQGRAREAAWERLAADHPRRVRRMRGAVDRWAASARLREAARTEVARVFWLLRDVVLRAGQLTGHGEDLFFLPAEEILTVLGGDEAPLAAVPARRAAYELYRSLPTYPTLIRGEFDPQVWAADPDRRADLYDAQRVVPPSDTVSGSPASGGVVEGVARVVATVEEGEVLRPGEILVTTVTNIGWTPLFTRISAIVTDVGANLSHASIVARELGIPAVVGCGNATTRIRTGDRIRVDGGRGTVEVLGTKETKETEEAGANGATKATEATGAV